MIKQDSKLSSWIPEHTLLAILLYNFQGYNPKQEEELAQVTLKQGRILKKVNEEMNDFLMNWVDSVSHPIYSEKVKLG